MTKLLFGLIEGLKMIKAPDQGMRYHGGGARKGGPKYDSQTGARVYPPHDPAELTVYGPRAQLLYSLIEHGPELAAELEALLAPPPQPTQEGGWRAIESAPKDCSLLLWVPGDDIAKDAVLIGGRGSRFGPSRPNDPYRFPTHWMPLPPAPQPKEG